MLRSRSRADFWPRSGHIDGCLAHGLMDLTLWESVCRYVSVLTHTSVLFNAESGRTGWRSCMNPERWVSTGRCALQTRVYYSKLMCIIILCASGCVCMSVCACV